MERVARICGIEFIMPQVEQVEGRALRYDVHYETDHPIQCSAKKKYLSKVIDTDLAQVYASSWKTQLADDRLLKRPRFKLWLLENDDPFYYLVRIDRRICRSQGA